jgi:hypothetical protein
MNRIGSLAPRRPAVRRSPLPVPWHLAACTVAVVGIGLLTALVGLGDLVFWTFFLVLGGLSAFNVVMGGRRPDGSVDVLAPPAPFSLVLFVMFGLGSVYGWTGLDPKQEHPNPLPALILATVGLAAYTAGYHMPVVRRARSVTARLSEWRPRRVIPLALVCILLGAIGTAAAFTSVEYFAWTQKTDTSLDAESQLGFLADFLFIGLTILAIIIASSMSRHRARTTLIVLALVEIAFFLPTGRRFYLFTILASVGFAWHYYISRIRPVHMVTLAVFTILLLNPMGQIWRTAYKTIGASGPGDIPAVVDEVGGQIASMTPGDYLNYAIGDRFERLNEAATVAAIRQTVPSTMDYKYGETYLPIVTWAVPRFLWHDKPTFQYFNEIGHTTGLIGPFDMVTTIVYTSIGELYLNFGDVGVPVGMFAIGMLSRWLYQALIAGTRNQTGLLLYGLLIMPLWSVEEALGPSMGGALRDVICCLLVLRLSGAMGRMTRTSRRGVVPHVGGEAQWPQR